MMMLPSSPQIPPWLDRVMKNPLAAAAALTLGVKMGQEVSRLRAQDISPEQFKEKMGGHIGSVSGTMVGLVTGWFIGRLVPGFGNVVGAFTGGLLGEIIGEQLGREGVERLHRSPNNTPQNEVSRDAAAGPDDPLEESGANPIENPDTDEV